MRNGTIALIALGLALPAAAQNSTPALRSPGDLQLIAVKAESVTYRGRAAVRITDTAPPQVNDAGRLAIVRDTAFTNGSIDLDVTGDTAANADPLFRGFVGLAFRINKTASAFECFYVRPKNGRAPTQLQRNHSTQYISVPDFPWQKLRAETPGEYESYVDLEPGAWTHLHLEIDGRTALVFVNGATQPTLLIKDLKLPVKAGGIGLWVGPGTIAHFANLTIHSVPEHASLIK